MQKCFGGPMSPFPATNHIFGHFRPNVDQFWEISKIQKIAKISIFHENSILNRVADIGRNDDIWPEMDSWDVLDVFCTKNRYPNASRSNFKPFWKNRFFADYHLWDPEKSTS